MKPTVGHKVKHVDETGKERDAKVTRAHTDEENPVVDLTHEDEQGNTVSKKAVPHESAVTEPRKHFWK